MADVRLAPQRLVPGGITPAYTGSLSVANTYQIRNGGNVMVHFKKSAAVDCVVTVETPATVGGLAVAERTFTVTATGGDIMAGPFTPSVYNDAIQDVRITLSDVDGLTVAVIKV